MRYDFNDRLPLALGPKHEPPKVTTCIHGNGLDERCEGCGRRMGAVKWVDPQLAGMPSDWQHPSAPLYEDDPTPAQRKANARLRASVDAMTTARTGPRIELDPAKVRVALAKIEAHLRENYGLTSKPPAVAVGVDLASPNGDSTCVALVKVENGQAQLQELHVGQMVWSFHPSKQGWWQGHVHGFGDGLVHVKVPHENPAPSAANPLGLTHRIVTEKIDDIETCPF